ALLLAILNRLPVNEATDARGAALARSGGMDHSTQQYDVCVIGSGPAGGVLAKELAESGAKVVMLEAGRQPDPEEFHYHAWPSDFPNRKIPGPGYPPELVDGIRYEDCDDIRVDRLRAVGGRSI